MDITIERAVFADADALVAVQVAAFHHDAVTYPGVELGGPPGYDSVPHMQRAIAEDEVYVALLDGEIVGGVVCYVQAYAEHMHLDVLFVAPEHHGRGIGGRLLTFVEAAFPVPLWTLDTPQYATRNHHFYEKYGYVRVGASDDASDVPLFAYEKRR